MSEDMKMCKEVPHEVLQAVVLEVVGHCLIGEMAERFKEHISFRVKFPIDLRINEIERRVIAIEKQLGIPTEDFGIYIFGEIV
jgi:hypothetical protein